MIQATHTLDQLLEEDEKTVKVMVPRKFFLRVSNGVVLEIRDGLQEFPEHLLDHWYVKANGVERYVEKTLKNSAAAIAAGANGAKKQTEQVITEVHAAFLKAAGYPVETVKDAEEFVSKLTDKEKVSFFADAAKEQK